MHFSMDKGLSFEQAVGVMFEKLGDWKIMALASSVNDYVMVRKTLSDTLADPEVRALLERIGGQYGG